MNHAVAMDAYQQHDYGAALAIWTSMAETGDHDAEAWVAAMYFNGEGTGQDYNKALDWYTRAAEGGNTMAQANLGTMYYLAQGTERNLEQAMHWSEAAAATGDLNGLFNLAVLCSKGDDTDSPVDNERAASLYLQAAQKGHYPSQSRIGYMYSQGLGVEKDRVQAYLWLTLAAQHGIGTALDALEVVVKQMSAEEKSQGEQLFHQWRHKTGVNQAQVALHPTPG